MSEIVVVPNAVLREVALPVKTLDKKVLAIIKDMQDVLKATRDPEGVGLAAPQIGINLRIFLTRPDPKKSPISVFINPEIIKSSLRQTKNNVYEGCLSIPKHYAPVTRSTSVTIKYQSLKPKMLNSKDQINYKLNDLLGLSISDLEFEDKVENFVAFPAHVIQHEMDHLNGILFVDRALEQNRKIYQVQDKEWVEVGV
jgi:peptide deformylase